MSISDVEAIMRQELRKTILKIGRADDLVGIVANIDSFLELSKGNNIVHEVHLDPVWHQNRM
jgi:hypothetical protein